MTIFKDYTDKFMIAVSGHQAVATFNSGWDGGSEIWLQCSCGWMGKTIERISLEDEMKRVKKEYREFYESYGAAIYQACSRICYGGADAKKLAFGQLVEHTGVNLEREFTDAKINYEKLNEEFKGGLTYTAAENLKNSIDTLSTVNNLKKLVMHYTPPVFVKVPHNIAVEWKELSGYSYDIN